jgi:hypothetical protein
LTAGFKSPAIRESSQTRVTGSGERSGRGEGDEAVVEEERRRSCGDELEGGWMGNGRDGARKEMEKEG